MYIILYYVKLFATVGNHVHRTLCHADNIVACLNSCNNMFYIEFITTIFESRLRFTYYYCQLLSNKLYRRFYLTSRLDNTDSITLLQNSRILDVELTVLSLIILFYIKKLLVTNIHDI